MNLLRRFLVPLILSIASGGLVVLVMKLSRPAGLLLDVAFLSAGAFLLVEATLIRRRQGEEIMDAPPKRFGVAFIFAAIPGLLSLLPPCRRQRVAAKLLTAGQFIRSYFARSRRSDIGPFPIAPTAESFRLFTPKYCVSQAQEHAAGAEPFHGASRADTVTSGGKDDAKRTRALWNIGVHQARQRQDDPCSGLR